MPPKTRPLITAIACLSLLAAGKAPKTGDPDALPEPVRATVTKNLPGGKILSFEHQAEGKRQLFYVDVQMTTGTVTLLASGRGQYLGQVSTEGEETDEVFLDKATAPQAVKDAIAKYYGKDPYDFLFMEVEEDRFIFCAEQAPAGKKTRWASFSILGELLEEENEVALTDLPAAVKQAITSARPSAKLDSASLVKAKDKTTYVADVAEGKNQFELTVTPDGAVTANVPVDDAEPATKP